DELVGHERRSHSFGGSQRRHRGHSGGEPMTRWPIVIVASLGVLALKLVGYLVPAEFRERPRRSRLANLLTVALLAPLVATQTLGSGNEIGLDARVPALGLAAVLFTLRVPFVIVIIAAAAAAALIRALVGG